MLRIKNQFRPLLKSFLRGLRKLFLGSSPKFGQIDSLIFTDWIEPLLQSGNLKEFNLTPEICMGGYFPITDNKVVVYEVAYTKERQVIRSFKCEKTHVTDAQAEALNKAEQTLEAMELKKKWGKIWKGVSTKTYEELLPELKLSKVRWAERKSVREPTMRAMQGSESIKGPVATVLNIVHGK